MQIVKSKVFMRHLRFDPSKQYVFKVNKLSIHKTCKDGFYFNHRYSKNRALYKADANYYICNVML